VVFCDGHVESPTLQFLFEDTSERRLVPLEPRHTSRTAKNFRRNLAGQSCRAAKSHRDDRE